MNNKFKKFVIIMIAILIIILMGILILNKKINNNQNTDVIEYEEEIVISNTLEKEKTRSNYYTVKNIVEKYFSSLCNLNKKVEDVLIFEYDEEVEHIEEETAQEIELTKNRIYDFFDEDCKKEIGLNINNIQNILGNYNDLYVLIEDMYVRELDIDLRTYFVFGTITEKDKTVNEKFELMIAMDTKKFTFNIYTQEYIEKYNLFELSKNEDFNESTFKLSGIENRQYNKYESETLNNEEHAKELLKSFTQSIRYNNIEYSYNRLNEEYKNAKFASLSDYKSYIEDKYSDIIKSSLNYYTINKLDDVTQYICVDQSNRYYIFNETSTMDFNLILDIYTIDLQSFIDKYNSSGENDKVILNIQKVVAATKDGDYKYVYGKLDDSFKMSNFKTQAKFEKYIKEKFDYSDVIEYTGYEKINNVYICKMEITKTSGEIIKAQIVMQLKEGTDFVMSFSKIEE